jgi:hypothetical protein
MYPESIPAGAAGSAERVLFRELRAQLSDEWTVLHSVRWLSHEGGRASDGEADFVVAHPDLGILVIEVKGGIIRRDGVTGAWTSEDVDGVIHSIHDPFLQAERSMHLLVRKLEESPTTRAFSYPYARSVAFPDVILPAGDLGPNVSRQIVIDSSNLFLLIGAIKSAMGTPRAKGPGKDGIRALVELLRPSLEISRRGLAAQIKSDEHELIQLTEQQLSLLDFLAGHRRVAISGTAGSGKTVLAIEQARRLAAQGYRVLFTCFNRALAHSVQQQLSASLGPAMANVTVRNYHELATGFAEAAGLRLPTEAEVNARPNPSSYFEEELPQRMLDALTALPDRFDAIVVDEGQDFADIWWLTLDALFQNPADSILAIFYDDNQRIYRRESAYPIPEPHYQLTHNCRCTQHIHREAAKYRAEQSQTSCRGPEGRRVETIPLQQESPVAALRKVVHRLVTEEGLPVEDIVVLTPRNQKTSAFTEGAKVGNLTLTWGDPATKSLACRSIHGFKGLESSVVVLGECDRAHQASRDALMHVALTRARHHVVVLGNLPAPGSA